MSHQVKKLMTDTNTEPFTSLIQIDENFVGGLNKNQHADKKVKASQEQQL